jgi:hypothetical protein
MNEKKFQGLELIEVYTEQAGKQIKYIVRLRHPLEKEIEIRKTHVRYGFVAVHSSEVYTHNNKKTRFSFHTRKDLAAKSAFNPGDMVVDIIKVEHRADQCIDCGNFEAIGKDVARCPACQAGGADQLKAEIAELLDNTTELKGIGPPVNSPDPDQEAIERDIQERIAAEARALGDAWIEECMHELNLKIVLREISEGERQVLAGILKQVRAGRGAISTMKGEEVDQDQVDHSLKSGPSAADINISDETATN